MPDNSISDVVGRFIENNRDRYVKLLQETRAICEEIQHEFGSTVVGLIYGRGQKQDGADLKTSAKIARALSLKRKTDPHASPTSIDDVIGLTMVVHYPDQINQVVLALRQKMIEWTTIEKNQYVSKNGYHAHHMVFLSNKVPHADLRCEVQIKTRLHDAWATKTHDLNYKPQGQTDERLSKLMQVFGDALQSIEVQSELLRQLIHERWNAEVERRRAVGKTLFDVLPAIRERHAFGPEATSLYGEIERLTAASSGASPDGLEWSRIFAKVVLLARAPSTRREGTWLLLRLAIASGDADHMIFARERVIDLLGQAAGLLETEIWSLPLGLSACGDLEGAIEASEYALKNVENLDDRSRALIKFNLADLLVQEASFGSPREATEAAQVRARVEALLAEYESLETRDPSVLDDVRAMLKVAFSDDPQQIREAIDQLYRAKEIAHPDDADIATAYFELNIRLAWRKLLELDARQVLKPPPMSGAGT